MTYMTIIIRTITLCCISVGCAMHVQRKAVSDPMTEYGFTQEEIDNLVDTMNDWRRTDAGVTASNMYHMTWDDNLAKDAMSWAKGCKFYHGRPTNPVFMSSDVGQNLGYVTGRFSNKLVPLEKWMQERFYYSFDTHTCYYPPCSHYTEAMWHSHTKVGCGTIDCEEVQDKNGVKLDSHSKMLVCHYFPGGNKVLSGGVPLPPWKPGNPCDDCDKCHDNLCATPDQCKPVGNLDCACTLKCKHCGTVTNHCKCDCPAGTFGDRCEYLCRDERPECTSFSASDCDNGTATGKILIEDCKVMCGRCAPNTNTSWTCGSETHANLFAKHGRNVQYGYSNSAGEKCVFPFLYGGEYHDKCIGTSSGYGPTAWCSKTANYDKYQTKVIGCLEVKTDKSKDCVLPFIYKNKYYQKCQLDGSKYWCGTTGNYDDDRQWGWCTNINSDNTKISCF